MTTGDAHAAPFCDESAAIVDHAEVAPGHFRMLLSAPSIAARALPGQFVQVEVAKTHDPLLRRPLSIGAADVAAGRIELLYKVVGKGTTILATRSVGESLSVLGPLGNPYALPDDGVAVLVGGGVGMPPLMFAAERLDRSRRHHVVQGARTAAGLFYEAEMKALGISHTVATEDGSAGVRGMVTDALSGVLDGLDVVDVVDGSEGSAVVLACGPTPMLEAVYRVACARGLQCQVSLEERMACGFGVCMGCAVELPGRAGDPPVYGLVCKDGPVFDAAEVFSLR